MVVGFEMTQLGDPFGRLPILHLRVVKAGGDEHIGISLRLDVVVGRVGEHVVVELLVGRSDVGGLPNERVAMGLDEFFEALTLIQTNKIEPFPIILVGSRYWKGLLDWIKDSLLDEYQSISPEDLDLIHLVDHEDEVLEVLNSFYEQYNLSPNF